MATPQSTPSSSTVKACQGMHQTLLVEEWNSMGATLSCINCKRTFHLDTNIVETFYTPFVYHSGDVGPEGDMELLVLTRILE